MVVVGRVARTLVRVPTPILDVDDLTCAAPPVQSIRQVLEPHSRVRVHDRRIERQTNMICGVLWQAIGWELGSVKIAGVPLAGLAVTSTRNADVRVVDKAPRAVQLSLPDLWHTKGSGRMRGVTEVGWAGTSHQLRERGRQVISVARAFVVKVIVSRLQLIGQCAVRRPRV